MPPKKLKKFCGITKFIQQNDKDLHQALDDLCLFGLFRPRGRGVTFLYPSDKAYRKKIIDHAYSNNPEKAVDMVRALVLLDYLPSPADFKNKKDDISNALHKKLEVDSADAKEVKLKSGHKLVIEATYKHLRDGDPVALYTMSGKGELPTTGTASTMKYNNSKSDIHTGGAHVSDAVDITNFVETSYIAGNKNIYKAVVCLIYKAVTDDDKFAYVREEIYSRICATARASFYNILRPWHKERNSKIDELINIIRLVHITNIESEMTTTLIQTYGVNEYTEHLTKLINQMRKVIDTTGRDEIQNKLLIEIRNPTGARLAVLNAYQTFYNQNKETVMEYIYRDLLTVYCYLSALNEQTDTCYFNTTFRFVMKHIFNHNNSFSESCNETVYNLSMFYNLVKSDAFLYTPVYDKTQIHGDYVDLEGCLPIPSDNTKFTTQFNSVVIVEGGGGDDSFFGGIVSGLK